jgi:hypothetical protein
LSTRADQPSTICGTDGRVLWQACRFNVQRPAMTVLLRHYPPGNCGGLFINAR